MAKTRTQSSKSKLNSNNIAVLNTSDKVKKSAEAAKQQYKRKHTGISVKLQSKSEEEKIFSIN